MTMNFKVYEEDIEDRVTKMKFRADFLNNGMYWFMNSEVVDPNNSGTFNLRHYHEGVQLKPSECKEIIEKVKFTKIIEGQVFFRDELRPGMAQWWERITGTLKLNELTFLTERISERDGKQVVWEKETVKIPFERFEKAVAECEKGRDEYFREIKIMPLVGQNCDKEELSIKSGAISSESVDK